MAGLTRGQLLAEEHGLLFTLHRGTTDTRTGTPKLRAAGGGERPDWLGGVTRLVALA